MRHLWFKYIIISFLVRIIMSSTIVTALASSTYGPYSYFTVYGHSYKNYASMVTGEVSKYAYAYTHMLTQNGSNVPAGYMRSKARMFTY